MDDAEKAAGYAENHNQDAVAKVLARRPTGPSAKLCKDCGENIPEERRRRVVGCRRCVSCQSLFEQEGKS